MTAHAIYHQASDAVHFPVRVDDAVVDASIGRVTLHLCYGLAGDPLAIYQFHAEEIDAAVRRRVASGPGAPVVLQHGDLLPGPAGEPPEAGFPEAERSELWRQGAKAAARGEADTANPMLHASNVPAATGETQDRWSERKGAWQDGHDLESAKEREHPS